MQTSSRIMQPEGLISCVGSLEIRYDFSMIRIGNLVLAIASLVAAVDGLVKVMGGLVVAVTSSVDVPVVQWKKLAAQ